MDWNGIGKFHGIFCSVIILRNVLPHFSCVDWISHSQWIYRGTIFLSEVRETHLSLFK